jgi:phosphoribosylglycinamide formyltransferase 2
LGYPIPEIYVTSPGASRPLKAEAEFGEYRIEGIGEALSVPQTQIRIFGNPITKVGRRIAVTLSTGNSISEARERAKQALDHLSIQGE